MLKHILFPTDGSSAALAAAHRLGEMFGGDTAVRFTVALVIEPLRAESTDYEEEIVERHNQKMRERAESALETTCRILSRNGVNCETKIVEGDPVSAALAAEAESGDYDVIAMGSRGLGMQKNNLHYLGSVTEHVIRRVSVPVLVVPIHKDK
jgi:nucleotide-binding universal stress UspA family protein